MKKNYITPYIISMAMDMNLLNNVSNVVIGGSGPVDAKEFSCDFDGEDE